MATTRTDFKDTLADEIKDLLKTNLGSAGLKEFYIGDPIVIPQTLMPCAVIEFEQTTYDAGPTGMDDAFHTIVIKLVFNKKDEFGKKGNEVSGHRTLHNLAEGIDESSGETSQSSVVGILRKNFTLNNESDDQSITIEYGIMPRPEDVITEEAHVRATIRQLTTVTSRS